MPTDFNAPEPSVPDAQMLPTEDVAKILNVFRTFVVSLVDAGRLGVVSRTDKGESQERRSKPTAPSKSLKVAMFWMSSQPFLKKPDSTPPTLRRAENESVRRAG